MDLFFKQSERRGEGGGGGGGEDRGNRATRMCFIKEVLDS